MTDTNIHDQGQRESAARRAWHRINARSDGSSLTPLWDALVSAPRNVVLDRAADLVEARAGEMEGRCESLLGGWPRPAEQTVGRSDAVAMQTIVSSYADALDQTNSVLDTIIASLDTATERRAAVTGQARKTMDNRLMGAEAALAAPSEHIDALTQSAIETTADIIADLEASHREYYAAQREYQQAMDDGHRCRRARAQVLVAWRLALMLEADLATLAR